MRKLIRTTIYLLYKHYLGGGTKSIAYESALMTTTFFIMIHVLQIKVLIFGGGITFGSNKIEKLLSVSVVFIPVYFLLYKVFKKQEILATESYYPVNAKKGYLYIILYCLLSFSLLTFLILWNKNII